MSAELPAPESVATSNPGPTPPGRRARSSTTSVLLVSAFATVLLGSVFLLLPVPFVLLRPGPAINTLGSQDGHPLITVTGHASYPAHGALDLTTVSLSGGPGSRLPLTEALAAWFDPGETVAPVSAVYPSGESVQSSRAQDREDMITSQESATVAALRELGIEVPATLTIAKVDASDSPLRAGDVITAVDGAAVPDLDTLTARIRRASAGTVLDVTVRRGGTEQVLRAPTHSSAGHTVLGVEIDPTFHPPFDVKIQIDNVGGPSAGTMFALGIIDLLTPGDLTGGQKIAGTGTIDIDGTVGGIGGIGEKMRGARSVGAEWFLAPGANCDEVVKHIPAGLHVVRITTLHEAHLAVEQIAAGQGASLPGCH